MPDFPIVLNANAVVLSMASPNSLGDVLNATAQTIAAQTNNVVNKVFYVPFSVQQTITIVKLFVINGGTAAGNFDIGIYDAGGTKLVSSGSTAQSGTSAIQEVDITDTTLTPGLYYLAFTGDTNTATYESWGLSAALARAFGICEQASTFPLPSTATFAALSANVRVPFVGATQRVTI